MTGEVITLLDNASATGSAADVQGGKYLFIEDGTQGGSTVSLQFLDPLSGTWVLVDGTEKTADGAVLLELCEGQYRAAVSGGTPSALYASLRQIVVDY